MKETIKINTKDTININMTSDHLMIEKSENTFGILLCYEPLLFF